MNPYIVLEINQDATQEQIRKAYIDKVKKYHPDLYVSFSKNDQQKAKEKLQEINNAYETLVSQKQQPQTNQYNHPNYQYKQKQDEQYFDKQFSRVKICVSEKKFKVAQIILNSFSNDQKDHRWYYWQCVVLLKQQQYNQALENIKIACELEPQDYQYDAMRKSIENMVNSKSYKNASKTKRQQKNRSEKKEILGYGLAGCLATVATILAGVFLYLFYVFIKN